MLTDTVMRQNISKVTINGLENTSYIDKVQNATTHTETSSAVSITGETDRVYQSVPTTSVIKVLDDNKPHFEITRDNLDDVVVWNPWTEKSKGMSDFGPEDGWRTM